MPRGRPFKKGQPSPNPSGRPRVAKEFRLKARAIVDEYVLERWKREILEDGPKWFEATKLLSEFAYGKPSQMVVTANTEVEAGTDLWQAVKNQMAIVESQED